MFCYQEDVRLAFLNISRIMDCVGCFKCRLWGKLQARMCYYTHGLLKTHLMSGNCFGALCCKKYHFQSFTCRKLSDIDSV